jgi:hypothetical protein
MIKRRKATKKLKCRKESPRRFIPIVRNIHIFA